ncbi:MAG TPA: aquaporin [Micropepsaceae bacterium]|nr:aquaporin [Micropepsaceae bacterium]
MDQIPANTLSSPETTAESARRFQDPQLEWHRLFAEFWGTFLTIVVTIGARVVAAKTGQVSPGMVYASRGIMGMAAILFLGTISGAHLNPAVTFGFALRGNFPWARVPGYLLAQLLGALLSAGVIAAFFGDLINADATTPAAGISAWQAFGMEVLLTAGLVQTILGTASDARNMGTNNAIAVGGYIILAGFWAGAVSGASMNPFRSLAPDVLRWNFSTTWIYFAGPLLGAVIGVTTEWLLKGAPTKAGNRAAQGGTEDKSGA